MVGCTGSCVFPSLDSGLKTGIMKNARGHGDRLMSQNRLERQKRSHTYTSKTEPNQRQLAKPKLMAEIPIFHKDSRATERRLLPPCDRTVLRNKCEA